MRGNSVLNEAEDAREQHKIGELKDRIAMEIMDYSTEKITKPETEINRLWERLVAAGIIKTVDENRLVTGKAEGNAIITARTTDGSDLTATCNILVPTKVTEITLNKTTETVAIGKTVTLTATVKPDNATNKNVTWNSSNTAVATVDDGVITGVSKGTTQITATASDGSEIISNACTITVRELTVADVVGEVFSTTSNTPIKDKNGNKIVIPAGFKVVPNGGTDSASKVTYSYNGDGTPAVQDGIVVQDGSGNQFVWVPVGTIKTIQQLQ